MWLYYLSKQFMHRTICIQRYRNLDFRVKMLFFEVLIEIIFIFVCLIRSRGQFMQQPLNSRVFLIGRTRYTWCFGYGSVWTCRPRSGLVDMGADRTGSSWNKWHRPGILCKIGSRRWHVQRMTWCKMDLYRGVSWYRHRLKWQLVFFLMRKKM